MTGGPTYSDVMEAAGYSTASVAPTPQITTRTFYDKGQAYIQTTGFTVGGRFVPYSSDEGQVLADTIRRTGSPEAREAVESSSLMSSELPNVSIAPRGPYSPLYTSGWVPPSDLRRTPVFGQSVMLSDRAGQHKAAMETFDAIKRMEDAKTRAAYAGLVPVSQPTPDRSRPYPLANNTMLEASMGGKDFGFGFTQRFEDTAPQLTQRDLRLQAGVVPVSQPTPERTKPQINKGGALLLGGTLAFTGRTALQVGASAIDIVGETGKLAFKNPALAIGFVGVTAVKGGLGAATEAGEIGVSAVRGQPFATRAGVLATQTFAFGSLGRFALGTGRLGFDVLKAQAAGVPASQTFVKFGPSSFVGFAEKPLANARTKAMVEYYFGDMKLGKTSLLKREIAARAQGKIIAADILEKKTGYFRRLSEAAIQLKPVSAPYRMREIATAEGRGYYSEAAGAATSAISDFEVASRLKTPKGMPVEPTTDIDIAGAVGRRTTSVNVVSSLRGGATVRGIQIIQEGPIKPTQGYAPQFVTAGEAFGRATLSSATRPTALVPQTDFVYFGRAQSAKGILPRGMRETVVEGPQGAVITIKGPIRAGGLRSYSKRVYSRGASGIYAESRIKAEFRDYIEARRRYISAQATARGVNIETAPAMKLARMQGKLGSAAVEIYGPSKKTPMRFVRADAIAKLNNRLRFVDAFKEKPGSSPAPVPSQPARAQSSPVGGGMAQVQVSETAATASGTTTTAKVFRPKWTPTENYPQGGAPAEPASFAAMPEKPVEVSGIRSGGETVSLNLNKIRSENRIDLSNKLSVGSATGTVSLSAALQRVTARQNPFSGIKQKPVEETRTRSEEQSRVSEFSLLKIGTIVGMKQMQRQAQPQPQIQLQKLKEPRPEQPKRPGNPERPTYPREPPVPRVVLGSKKGGESQKRKKPSFGEGRLSRFKRRVTTVPQIDFGSRTVAQFRYGTAGGNLTPAQARAEYARTAGMAVRTPEEIRESMRSRQGRIKISLGVRRR